MSPTIVEPNLYWPFSKLTIMTKSRLQKTKYKNRRMANIECIDSFFMEKELRHVVEIYIYIFLQIMKLPSSIVLTSRAVAGKSSIGRCLVVSDGVKTGDGRGWYFRPLLLFTGLMSEIRDLNINHLFWLTGSI